MLAYDEDGDITNLEEYMPNDLVRDDGREFLDGEVTDDNDNTVEWDEQTDSYKTVKV